MELLGKIEAEAGRIVVSRGTALQRMRNLVASVEKAFYKQYMLDRKLHELIEAAVTENWTTMRAHDHRMNLLLEQIIASGMAAGEFHPGDAALAARLVRTPPASASVIRASWRNMSWSRNRLSITCSILPGRAR